MSRVLAVLTTIFIICLLYSVSSNRGLLAAETEENKERSLSASRSVREEKAIQDARRRQLVEREAAAAAKEEELKRLSAKLDEQMKVLEESRTLLDNSLKVKKEQRDEKQKKMIGLFKKMRPEQAGQLIDQLDERQAISLLDQMDARTVTKLMPYLKQPRVLKWIEESLGGV